MNLTNEVDFSNNSYLNEDLEFTISQMSKAEMECIVSDATNISIKGKNKLSLIFKTYIYSLVNTLVIVIKHIIFQFLFYSNLY
jgi:hypothetical protein